MKDKKYRRMRVDVFQHERTRDLSAVAKILMVYLLTPHCSAICCKSIVQMRNGVDMKLDIETVRAALGELVAAEIVEWDEQHEVVWVVEGLDEQVCGDHPRHPNIAKSVLAHLDTLPPSSLIARLLERYGPWLRSSGVLLGAAPEPTLRVVPSPSQDGPRTFVEVEAAMVKAFSAALGCLVHEDTVKYAMELWQGQAATEAELLQVVEWWATNRRTANCELRWCFARYGERANWARVSATVLGREPQKRGRKRPAAASIDDVRAAYDRGGR